MKFLLLKIKLNNDICFIAYILIKDNIFINNGIAAKYNFDNAALTKNKRKDIKRIINLSKVKYDKNIYIIIIFNLT